MKQAVLCMCLVALAACSRNQAKEDVASTTTLTAAEAPGAPKPTVATFLDDNPALTRRVEAAIAGDPNLTIAARNVNVSTIGPILQFRGSVPDYATRDQLEALVSSIVPLQRTYYEIEVNPIRDLDDGESDDNIAFSLNRSLVDQERVTVDVVRGIVTLRGKADDVELTGVIAERTPGVVVVVNELELDEIPPTATTSLVQ